MLLVSVDSIDVFEFEALRVCYQVCLIQASESLASRMAYSSQKAGINYNLDITSGWDSEGEVSKHAHSTQTVNP